MMVQQGVSKFLSTVLVVILVWITQCAAQFDDDEFDRRQNQAIAYIVGFTVTGFILVFCIPICCFVIILTVFFCFIKKANDHNRSTVTVQPTTRSTVNPTNVTFSPANTSSPATVTYQQNSSLQQEPPPAYSAATTQPANPAYPPLQNPPQQAPYPPGPYQQGPLSSEVYPPPAATAYPPYPPENVGYPQDSEKKTSDF